MSKPSPKPESPQVGAAAPANLAVDPVPPLHGKPETDAERTARLAAPPKPESEPAKAAVKKVAPKEPPKTGLALLQSLYADPKSGEPTALKWRATVPGDRQVIVSKFGTLLFPDNSLAVFNPADAIEVRRYLAALRPNDEIQLSNIS